MSIASSMPNPSPSELGAEVKTESVDTLPHVPQRPCVLVVDDEARIRAWLSVALPQNGFQVKLAADGEEALGIYRSSAPKIALVLLDVLMPGMDGPRTLQALQSVNPKVCCCFLNERNVYSQPELLALGAARVFPKMPSLPELVQSLWLLAANVDEAELPILSIPTRIGSNQSSREGEAATEPRLQERRACVRYLCHLDGSCQPVGQPATGESWIGKLRDISSTGLKILVNRRFEVGTLLVLDLPRPGWDQSRMLLFRAVRTFKELIGRDWEIVS